MNCNVHELKERPIINFWASYYWHKKLTPDEIYEWQNECREEFYEKFPHGSKVEMSRYLEECAQIIENEYKSIHLPNELI